MDKKEVKTGEIWRLGDHVLVCGDSTTTEATEAGMKAMGVGVRAIVTDPPYGVAYVENKEHFKTGGESQISVAIKIQGDQIQTEEEYTQFTKNWLEKIVPHLAKYNAAYIFNADPMYLALRQGMTGAGFYYSQMIIWIKNSVVIGRKDYLPQHELIAYGWYGRHKMESGKRKSVIFCPKPSSSKLHPTMKPVSLIRQLILSSTKIGDTVFDPFGGSGTTLIACEHTKRKCLMIEASEQYAAVILERWEKLTGKEAIKA